MNTPRAGSCVMIAVTISLTCVTEVSTQEFRDSRGNGIVRAAHSGVPLFTVRRLEWVCTDVVDVQIVATRQADASSSIIFGTVRIGNISVPQELVEEVVSIHRDFSQVTMSPRCVGDTPEILFNYATKLTENEDDIGRGTAEIDSRTVTLRRQGRE